MHNFKSAAIAIALVSSPAWVHAADLAHGKELFAACAACHSGGSGSLGPNLRGVFGRKSAQDDDFRYSTPMKRANLTWDEANLRAYLKDPQGLVNGNRMPFGGFDNPKDIEDVIAYLKTYR